MKQLRALNFRRLLLVAGLALALTIVLLFWARDLIREVFVLPLSYLFWVIGLVVRVTPEVFFWGGVIIISVVIAWSSLSGRRKKKRIPHLPPPPDGTGAHGRVIYWANKVNLMKAGQGTYFGSVYHYPLSRLLLEMVAHRNRLTPPQVEDRLREGSLDIPEDIGSFLVESLQPRERSYPSVWQQIWNDLREVIHSWLINLGLAKLNQPDPRIARVIEYMQTELEVPHDVTGR